MKKIIVYLIIVLSCFAQTIDKSVKSYNNNFDKFKTQEIIDIENSIKRNIYIDGYLIFYDKNNNIVKIEEESESESGDSLTYLRQYYRANSLIYFEYLVNVLPEPETNFVAKCYLKNNKISKYKIYENKKMKKWKEKKIKEAFSYPMNLFIEYFK